MGYKYIEIIFRHFNVSEFIIKNYSNLVLSLIKTSVLFVPATFALSKLRKLSPYSGTYNEIINGIGIMRKRNDVEILSFQQISDILKTKFSNLQFYKKSNLLRMKNGGILNLTKEKLLLEFL